MDLVGCNYPDAVAARMISAKITMNHVTPPSAIPMIACLCPILPGSCFAALSPKKPWTIASVPAMSPAKPAGVAKVNIPKMRETSPLIIALVARKLRGGS